MRARAAGACWPLYYKYSAPRARLVYLLWNKSNCYSMTSRICRRSFGKFPADQCKYVALRIFTPKSHNSRDDRRFGDCAQTNSKSFPSASRSLRRDSKKNPKSCVWVFNFSRKSPSLKKLGLLFFRAAFELEFMKFWHRRFGKLIKVTQWPSTTAWL